MCVKTKTEWSCGCYKKALSTCDHAPSSNTACPTVDKYRYLDDGDCPTCKAGGADITRGQDGKGRYAREIAAREKKSKSSSQRQQQPSRAILGEITGNGSQCGSDKNLHPSTAPIAIVTSDPWMKATRREKEWQSPNRRHADQEWEREHARRKEDIESLAQSHSSSPKRRSPRHTPEQQSPLLPYEVINNETEDSAPLAAHRRRRDSGSLHLELNRAMLSESPPTVTNVRPAYGRRGSRHGSFESIESVPSRGRSRTLPFQYGYASDFGYAVETRVPRDAYFGRRY